MLVLSELLEDNPKIQSIEKSLNGIDAIEKIEEKYHQGKWYDLILLDLNMPIKDGIETITELKEKERLKELNLSRTKIIAASAIDEPHF